MKKKFENILNLMCDTGASYADIFKEDTLERSIKLLDGKIDKVDTEIIKGIGLRVCNEHNTFYSAINNCDEVMLEKEAINLSSNIKSKRKIDDIKLKDLIDDTIYEDCILSDKEKKEYLLNIDNIARNFNVKIFQVSASISERVQNVLIASSDNNFVKTTRLLKRLTVVVMAKDGDKKTQSVYSVGSTGDYSFLKNIDIEKEIKRIVDSALEKLDAEYAPGGVMPVIISNDSGVLIHEACGHALEATSVADDASVLSHSLGKKIANNIVTIIDDGTIPNLYGTTLYDDEGEKTRKNILVENGVAKSFLVDKKNGKRMNHLITSSSRRECYHYAPTSRMNNTYLDKGASKVENMIKSVDYGLYVKTLGGGQVNPITGDFNFGVNEAYMIRNGNISEMVIGASLIGNIKEVLFNIVEISDDLNFDVGMCGSESGSCPVTCGQPTIKLSSMLVGGKK